MNYSDRLKDIEQLLPHKERRPFSDTALFKLREASRIPFVYALSAFEGSTLTEYETKALLKECAKLPSHSEFEIQDALELSNAYNLMFKLLKKEKIDADDILELHKTYSAHINADEAGRYRRKNLIISETSYTPAPFEKIPVLTDEFLNLMPQIEKILHPIEYAAWIHLNFLNIYPFDYGCIVCAVLLSNYAALKAGYPLIIIPPVLKDDYYDALTSAQKDKEPSMFEAFISEAAYESARDFARTEGNV